MAFQGRPIAYVYSCNIYAVYCIFIQFNGLFLYFYTMCAYKADNYRYLYLVDGQLTPLSFPPCQKPEHSACFALGMFGYSRLLLVDKLVDNLPCVTIFVLYVHTVHNRLVLFVQSRIIYA